MQLHAITYNIHGLPWSNTNLEQILSWMLELRVPLLCFQEVFTAHARRRIQERLERQGYRVLLPMDEGVSLFPSGLVTAVRLDTYTVLGASFQPFLSYHNAEIFANKGFHRVTLRDRASNILFHILNTHTQSDEEVLWWSPYAHKKAIRRKQAEQIIEYCKEYREPVLVMGDFNQESSLHPNLRTLHPTSPLPSLPLKKATFFRTGEDLDHVAWMPLQWYNGDKDKDNICGFCGRYGPLLEFCKVHSEAWSDHAAVEMKVNIRPL